MYFMRLLHDFMCKAQNFHHFIKDLIRPLKSKSNPSHSIGHLLCVFHARIVNQPVIIGLELHIHLCSVADQPKCLGLVIGCKITKHIFSFIRPQIRRPDIVLISNLFLYEKREYSIFIYGRLTSFILASYEIIIYFYMVKHSPYPGALCTVITDNSSSSSSSINIF